MFRTESVRNLALLRPRRDQSEIEVEETDSLLENENIGMKRIHEVVVLFPPEPFAYDADGNTLSDGRWNYTWDAENRLTKMEIGRAHV